jgi:hypothetical protein
MIIMIGLEIMLIVIAINWMVVKLYYQQILIVVDVETDAVQVMIVLMVSAK